MRSTRVAFVLACLLALQGCAAAALSIAGMAGGAGLDHTLNGIVTRTYSSPMAGTRLAAHQTLRRMGMKLVRSERDDAVWSIEAEAVDRKIDIELEALSTRSTRARVVVSKSDFIFIKDSSTGNEIIDQMAVELSRFTFKRVRLATAQTLLSELGYDAGEADGLMGKKTRNAIVRFQRKNRLQVDGKVDRKLMAKLEKKSAARAAARRRADQARQGETN